MTTNVDPPCPECFCGGAGGATAALDGGGATAAGGSGEPGGSGGSAGSPQGNYDCSAACATAGRCVPTDRCAPVPLDDQSYVGWMYCCEVDDDADCEASTDCAIYGRCAIGNMPTGARGCVAKTDGHCAASAQCIDPSYARCYVCPDGNCGPISPCPCYL